MSFDVIINATSLGMGTNRQSPLEEKELNTKFLFDLVYVPAETKLVKMARAKNITVIPGLEMFVQQGARQFEIWTGKPAPIAEMSFVVTKALERLEVLPVEEEPAAPKTASGGENGIEPARQGGSKSRRQRNGETTRQASCEENGEKSSKEAGETLVSRGFRPARVPINSIEECLPSSPRHPPMA